jgi:transcriptional regulator with XRE-family HTH domain
MTKQISKKDSYTVAVGNRLKQVIFSKQLSQTQFAKENNLDVSALNHYINGSRLIPIDVANSLQKISGVSKWYLYDGIEPMIIKDEDIKTKIGQLEKVRKETTAHQGVIPNLIMSREGLNSEIANRGEFNVVGIAINGIKEPQAVEIRDEVFVDTYYKICPLVLNCHLIVSTSFFDGDIVLIKTGREHKIAVLYDEKYYEVINKTELILSKGNVVGKIYSIVIKFKLKNLIIKKKKKKF